MPALPLLLTALVGVTGAAGFTGNQAVERQHVLSITAGRDARRLLKGDFTLPAWSDDGKAIAAAEKKDGGRRWDISVVLLPENLGSRK